jgi:lipopolysaccharide export system permease protein
MTGLGMLASSSELTIMRAAGVSIGRIVWWVVKPALIFVAAGLLLTQYVVPVSEKLSEQRKDNAMEGASTMKWFKSSWQREGKNILQIGKVEKDGSLRDVTLFYFNDNNFLESASLVGQAHYDGKQGWQLRDLKTTEIREDGSTQLKKVAEAYWPSQLTPSYLSLLTQDAESLSLTDLYQYAHYMKAQGLDSDSWFLQFWKKALAPLATLSMVLIACSFIFGPLRSVTMGLRILAGVLAGLTFRYGQDFLGYASLVYDFSPALAASIPIACCLLIGGVALARVK